MRALSRVVRYESCTRTSGSPPCSIRMAFPARLLCVLLLARAESLSLWGRLRSGLGVPCEFASSRAEAVRATLATRLIAQEAAVANITRAFSEWEAKVADGIFEPLVIVLTGSTGVGKTEAANAIAEALLTGRESMSGAGRSGRTRPEGLLDFVGHELADEGSAARVRAAIAQVLQECHGHVVIFIDEAQAAAAEAIAALRPLLDGSSARFKVPGTSQSLDASRVVLVVVADVGVSDIEAFYKEARAAGSVTGSGLKRGLDQRLRRTLSAEFSERGLDLGKLAEHIIPFAPFNASGVRRLISTEVKKLRARNSDLRKAVDSIRVTLAARTLLSLPSSFIDYDLDSSVKGGAAGDADGSDGGASSRSCRDDIIALRAARVAQHAERASAHVDADGEAHFTFSEDTESDRSEDLSAHMVCGEVCEMPPLCMTRNGARSIIVHDQSPVKRLARTLRAVLGEHPTATALRAADEAQHGFIGMAKRKPLRVDVVVDVACDAPGVGPFDGSCSLKGVQLKFKRCVSASVPLGERQASACERVWMGELAA